MITSKIMQIFVTLMIFIVWFPDTRFQFSPNREISKKSKRIMTNNTLPNAFFAHWLKTLYCILNPIYKWVSLGLSVPLIIFLFLNITLIYIMDHLFVIYFVVETPLNFFSFINGKFGKFHFFFFDNF